MMYERVPVHSVVFEQGDMGDKLYMVLRGSFSVHIRSAITSENDSRTSTDASPTMLEHSICDEGNEDGSCSDGDEEWEPTERQTRLGPAQDSIRRLMAPIEHPERNLAAMNSEPGASATEAAESTHWTPIEKYRQRSLRDHIELQNANFVSLFGPCVVTLTPGCTFGELALMHRAPRGGTIVSRSDSILVTLRRRHCKLQLSGVGFRFDQAKQTCER
jgi:CRP-like cAMP-binding protein